MSTLLYIEASPRKEKSISIQVSQAFLQAYQQSHPNDQIIKLDLWQLLLPEVEDQLLESRYALAQNQSPTAEQKAAWKAVENIISQFKQADRYLFSIPMWNFSIPYKLKHYIDLIVQPDYTFSFSPQEGYKGLVGNKPAAVVYARGGEYSSEIGPELKDFQTRYFETVLNFMGITTIQSIIAGPTAGPKKEEAVEQAIQQAVQIAAKF